MTDTQVMSHFPQKNQVAKCSNVSGTKLQRTVRKPVRQLIKGAFQCLRGDVTTARQPALADLLKQRIIAAGFPRPRQFPALRLENLFHTVDKHFYPPGIHLTGVK